MACVRLFKGQILEIHRSADGKVFMVVRVSKTRSRSEESMAMHGVSVGILVGECKCVQVSVETNLLGFGRKRPWSTSMRPWSTSIWLV